MKRTINFINLFFTFFLLLSFHSFSQEINYIPFKTSTSISSETIDLSDDYYVGSINGRAGSSGQGAGTYQTVIEIPDAPNGMQPHITINYSSMSSKNGVLGKGWSLGGVSVIGRVPQTHYHDSDLEGVKYTNADRFALDGARMYPLSGNGEDGTIYKTEHENQSRILSTGNVNNSPDYFTIETKNGITHIYGGEANSKILDENNVPIMWFISATYDRFGNHIRYFYEDVNGEHRIHSITYNGNSSEPHSSVKFNYKEREDKNFSYINGRKSEQRSLLDNIQVYYGENLYIPDPSSLLMFTYEFKYSLDRTDSYLSEIHKISGEGTRKYNPTIFYYGKFDQAPVLTESTYALTNSTFNNHQDYFIGDFNGDGLSDIVKLEVKQGNWAVDPNLYSDNGSVTYKGFTVALNNGDGNSYTSLPRVGFLDNGTIPHHVQYLSCNNRIVVRTGDFDGDNKDEILVVEFESHFSPNKMYSYSIFDVEGGGVIEFAHQFGDQTNQYVNLNKDHNINGETRHLYIFNNAFVLGDFDGDQAQDIIFNYHYDVDNKNRSFLHRPRINNIMEIETLAPNGVPYYLLFQDYTRPPSLTAYDVDKDGDQELLAVYDSLLYPMLQNYLASSDDGQASWVESFFYDHPQAYIIAHDIYHDQEERGMIASNGTLLFHSAFPGYFSSDQSEEAEDYINNQIFNAEPYGGIKNMRCADFNGDGIMDIKFEAKNITDFKTYITYGKTSVIDFSESIKANIWTDYITELDFGITQDNFMYHRILPIDYNLDGLADFIELDKDGYFGNSRITIHYNKGNGQYGQVSHVNSTWTRGYVETNAGTGIVWDIYPGHFNRDSKLDLLFDISANITLGYNFNQNEHLIFLEKKDNLEDDLHHLVSVRNGLGEVSKYRYLMMTDPTIYTKGAHAQYPFVDLQSNVPLLYSLHKDNGIDGFLSSTFHYKYATSHKRGKGYLGFDQVVNTEPELNIKRVFKYSLLTEPIEKVLSVTEVFNTTEPVDELISRVKINYETPTLNSALLSFSDNIHKCFRFNKSEQTTAHYLNGGVERKRYSYDLYDNVLTYNQQIYNKATFDINDNFIFNSSNLIQDISQIYEYDQFATWIPASMTKKTSTQDYFSGASSTNQTTVEKYTYYSNGLPHYIHHFFGSPKAYYTKNTYHSNGLLETSRQGGGGGTRNLTTFAYDNFNRLISETNALGDQTEYSYFDSGIKGGKFEQVKLPSGITMEYDYDEFGFIDEETDERGNTAYTTKSWVTNSSTIINTNARYQIEVSKGGSADEIVLNDRLNRQVRTKRQQLNDMESIIDIEYNALGLVKKQTEPYQVGQILPVHYTSFHYDKYNRLEEKIRFSNTGGNDVTSYLKARTVYAMPKPLPSATYRAISKTFPDGRIKTQYTDFTGKLLEVIENGTSVLYDYYNSGYLKSSKVATPSSSGGSYEQTMVTYNYDIQGNIIQRIDNSIGTENFAFNDYGDLISETNSNGDITTYTYDNLGRTLITTRPEGTTTNTYWTSSDITPIGGMKPGLGQLKTKVLNASGAIKSKISYEYNQYGEIEEEKDEFETESPVIFNYTYNSFGQLSSKEFSTGFILNYVYQPNNGSLSKILSPSITTGYSSELLKVVNTDAYGHITEYKRGGSNNLITNNTYNERANLLKSKTGTILELDYNFNHQSGNLRSKTNALTGKTENFKYDNFDRLKTSQVSTSITQYYGNGAYTNFESQEPIIQVDFDDTQNLNIRSKSQVAENITYDASSVNQMDGYTLPANVTPNLALGSILINTNTSFHKPKVIKTDVNGEIFEANFDFGVDLLRRKSVITHNNVLTKKRLYYGDYEELSTYNPDGSLANTYQIHYVGIGQGLEFMYTTKNNVSSGWDNMFFTHKDYQGTILKVTDRNGIVQGDLEYSYDAWGRRRNKDTWTYDGSSIDLVATGGVDEDGNPWVASDDDTPEETIAPPQASPTSSVGTEWFNRGYTGHEHMDDFQLIHMNARLYNPYLGTFLSPDRYISNPANSQNYNRYSYALGNPTKYTDPTGNSPFPSIFSGISSFFSKLFSFGSFFGSGSSIGSTNCNFQNAGTQFNNVTTADKTNGKYQPDKTRGRYYSSNSKFLGYSNVQGIHIVTDTDEIKSLNDTLKGDKKAFKKSNAHEFSVTSLTEVKSALTLPPMQIRKEMTQVFEMEAEENRREYGGVVAVDRGGELMVIWAKPGPIIEKWSADAEIDPRKPAADQMDKVNRISEVLFTFHSHPDIVVGVNIKPEAGSTGTTIGGAAAEKTDYWPSTFVNDKGEYSGDIVNQKQRLESAYISQNSYVLASHGNGVVTIYNGDLKKERGLASISLSLWLDQLK